MATYLPWSAKALKQSWLDKRLYNVMQHDRNIGMYTKYLQYKLVNYTEVIVIKTRPPTTITEQHLKNALPDAFVYKIL